MDNQYYRKARSKVSFASLSRNIVKKKTLFLTLLILIPVFSFVTFSNKGIVQRMSLESEKRAMEEKLSDGQLAQQRLQQQSKALDNNPRAIEKVAREKYGMVRDGETVYKVKKEK